jgi:hypothetical protein
MLLRSICAVALIVGLAIPVQAQELQRRTFSTWATKECK